MRSLWKIEYLNDWMQQSVSSYVLDVQVMGIERNHAQEVGHVGKMDAKKLHHVLLHRNDDRQVKAKSIAIY